MKTNNFEAQAPANADQQSSKDEAFNAFWAKHQAEHRTKQDSTENRKDYRVQGLQFEPDRGEYMSKETAKRLLQLRYKIEDLAKTMIVERHHVAALVKLAGFEPYTGGHHVAIHLHSAPCPRLVLVTSKTPDWQ